MKLVRCYWRTDRRCPHPPLCHYGYECVARPKGKATMPTVIKGELLATLKAAELVARQIVDNHPELFADVIAVLRETRQPAPPAGGGAAGDTPKEAA